MLSRALIDESESPMPRVFKSGYIHRKHNGNRGVFLGIPFNEIFTQTSSWLSKSSCDPT